MKVSHGSGVLVKMQNENLLVFKITGLFTWLAGSI
jgi:hypothetical protein